MPRLNDQFMEALSVDGRRLKVEPVGYHVIEHEQDGVSVKVSLDPWHQPYVVVADGDWKGKLLKGGIALKGIGDTFEKSDILEPGLHVVNDNPDDDRRVLIVDSAEEEVLVSHWDPDAPSTDAEGFDDPGLYGDYTPASPQDAETIKQNAQRVIDAARVAVDACVA
jgi:hypothetical protein